MVSLMVITLVIGRWCKCSVASYKQNVNDQKFTTLMKTETLLHLPNFSKLAFKL